MIFAHFGKSEEIEEFPAQSLRLRNKDEFDHGPKTVKPCSYELVCIKVLTKQNKQLPLHYKDNYSCLRSKIHTTKLFPRQTSVENYVGRAVVNERRQHITLLQNFQHRVISGS